MITIEQLRTALGDDKKPFQNGDIDHNSIAIMLLRNRIPYDTCKSIIGVAEHDVLFLCDIEKALPYLSEDDLTILADCNVCLNEEYECLFLFV